MNCGRAVSVSDADTAVGALTLSGSVADPALVPAGNLVFSGTSGARTLTIYPTAGLAGTTTVTVTVSDGLAMMACSFNLTVLNQAQTWR